MIYAKAPISISNQHHYIQPRITYCIYIQYIYNGSILMERPITLKNKTRGRNKRKNLPVNSDVPKRRQKTKIAKGDDMDMSAGIIDIDDTPDIATWNKKIHMKDYAAGILAPTTIGIGLREKKGSKDLIRDPANKKEVDEALKSGLTFTDQADDLS
jgi:hypothetical protein